MTRKKLEYVFALITGDDIYIFDNCLVTEIRSQNEKSFLTCIFCSSSLNQDEFQNFCVNSDTLLDNINGAFWICSVATNHFNANTSRWWKNDITNSAGLEHDSSLSLSFSLSLTHTSSAGYTQIIDEPTHTVNKFNTNQNVISKQLLNQVFIQVRHALPNYYQ